jgi:hypothetical protein
MGAWGDTTPTDPRSRRNRASRRGGQLLTRALGSSYASACPHFVLPVPLSRMVAPYARTLRIPAEQWHRHLHTGYQSGRLLPQQRKTAPNGRQGSSTCGAEFVEGCVMVRPQARQETMERRRHERSQAVGLAGIDAGAPHELHRPGADGLRSPPRGQRCWGASEHFRLILRPSGSIIPSGRPRHRSTR